MAPCVALLRGINLGSHKRVKMPDLRALATELGYGDPRTYLQSGNLVVDTDRPPEVVARELADAIPARFGFSAAVIVRTPAELADVVAADPLGAIATDPARYHVSFLDSELEPEVAERLRAADVAPEQVVVRGREVYTWHPEGVQRSRLAALVTERALRVTPTARNRRTVCALLDMLDAP